MLEPATIDDELLTRYLLGSLGAEETERLDELSVTDGDIAWRLRTVENDLVDAYARGELSGQALQRFESSYLSFPRRRQKVAVATTLAMREQRTVADAPAPSKVRTLPSPRLTRWAIAASIVAVTAATYLTLEPQRNGQQVPNEIAVGTVTPHLPAMPPQQTETTAPASTVSFILPVPMRAAGPLQTLTVRAGIGTVALRLQLESDDFPQYEGALRDLRTNEIVWASEAVRSTPEGVPMNVPAATLKQDNYSLELSGLPEGRSAELIASYAFRVLPEK